MILARTIVRAGVVLALSALAAAPATSQGLLKKTTLSAALAHEALTTAVETCAKQDQQVTGVVLDSSGVQQAFLRGDNAGRPTPRCRSGPTASTWSNDRRRAAFPARSTACRG
jgi:hypothetical protein